MAEEDLNWEKAENRSDLFSRYWYHPSAGDILKEIDGSSSITFLNDRKYISIYATFSAIRKDIENLRNEIRELEEQESVDSDLRGRVRALEEKLPKTRVEKIRYDLVNSDLKQKTIAEKYDVSPEYVSKVKREAGIQ